MSYVANRMIADAVMDKLKDMVPYGMMETVIQAVTDVLADYEITPNEVRETGTDMMLDAFMDAMSVEGRSPKTLERYRYILGRFLKSTGTTSMNITQYHIRQYLSAEKARGIADSTIRGYCWVFGSYFGWLHRDGIIARNPMGNIGRIKVQKKVREVFTEVEIERLKAGCKTIRDRAIIHVLKSTGCRISEITSLNRDDIDFASLECIVLGKGNKQRAVYMDPVTGMILKQYLDERKDDEPALFLGQRKERLQPSGVRQMLKNLGKRAHVAHVHPHKFRRTEITELVNRGMPIEQVKMLAGHEMIDTTLRYVTMDQQNVKNNYHKYA